MFEKLHKRMKGEGGFTLIELLVVIIIIAILAAIAIPTFLGQRHKAQDAAAKSLVRNAMTAVESAYVDERNFENIAVGDIMNIEPAITFTADQGTEGTLVASSASLLLGASLTSADTVDYNGVTGASPVGSMYEIATVSESGNEFGVSVNKGSGGGTTFVKEINTEISTGW